MKLNFYREYEINTREYVVREVLRDYRGKIIPKKMPYPHMGTS